jgi:hypothetical protein
MGPITTTCTYLSIAAVAISATTCVLVVILAMTATWSRKPYRRHAASNLLHQILDALHRRR